jgi:tyrosine ammonia-lyase
MKALHDFHMPIIVGESDQPIRVGDVEAIAAAMHPVEISQSALDRAALSENMITRLIAEQRIIYGVTTGYGPLADNQIDPDKGSELQRKLVYHLASGVGTPFSEVEARAIMVARFSAAKLY